MSENTHLLVGENGEPLGVIDMDAIQARATLLGFDLSVACDDATELDRISAEALAEVGPREFGYVAAAALRHVIENVVDPLMAIANAYEIPVHEQMAEAAKQAREGMAADT